MVSRREVEGPRRRVLADALGSFPAATTTEHKKSQTRGKRHIIASHSDKSEEKGTALSLTCPFSQAPAMNPLYSTWRRTMPSCWHFLYRWLRSSPRAFAVLVT